MPHSDRPDPTPAPADKPEPAAPPAVRAGRKCPSCGRSPAIVFRAVRPGVPRKHTPLVCLDCCPRSPARP